MARRARHAPLNVFLNSRLIGRLRREASGALDFTYDPEWQARETAVALTAASIA